MMTALEQYDPQIYELLKQSRLAKAVRCGLSLGKLRFQGGYEAAEAV